MIRHFATRGNLQKRYIGVTDESLWEEEKLKLEKTTYPMVDAVYSSPLIRCIKTAKLIYPNAVPIIYEGLKECDFGDFENKNYIDLKGNPDYQAFIDSGGTTTFPHGENPQDFKLRCVATFEEIGRISLVDGYKTIALVVHGGTIMSILDKYVYPHEDYYHWQVGNGEGYNTEFDNKKGRITNLCTIRL